MNQTSTLEVDRELLASISQQPIARFHFQVVDTYWAMFSLVVFLTAQFKPEHIEIVFNSCIYFEFGPVARH